MATIYLETILNAPLEKCFNLSRSIDLHLKSTTKTREIVFEGKKSGLLEEGDEITWQATHFGIRQKLKIKMTKVEFPVYFSDEMLEGAFASMKHEHFFYDKGNYTLMVDVFKYEVPFSILGKLFDHLILKRYMTNFLLERNRVIASELE